MSVAIGSELHHFLNCLWYGVVLFGVYDGLRIFRALIRHGSWLVGMEDIVFWIWAAFYLFSHFFMDTYGTVRGYQLLGVGAGGGIWEYGCGRFLTKKIIFCIRQLKFRVSRCKIFIGMRSLMLQKKNQKRAKKQSKKELEKAHEGEAQDRNSDSVTGGKTTGEKNARKKSKKKSEKKKIFQSKKKLYSEQSSD